MRRLRFLRQASLSGWRWLVEVTNHIGAALILLAVVGVSVLSGWKLPHWWLGPLIFAAFYVVVFGEGAFRVWRDSESRLVAARAELGDLDTTEAKVAYLDRCLREAQELIDEIGDPAFDDAAVWAEQMNRIEADLIHWEDKVRAEIKRSLGSEKARLFDSHPEKGNSDTVEQPVDRDHVRSYLERRAIRLRELKDEQTLHPTVATHLMNQERSRRDNIIGQIRNEYRAGYMTIHGDSIPHAIMMGTMHVPQDYLNQKLAQRGEDWRV